MKIVVQRVLSAGVAVAEKNIAAIGPGILVLIGITHSDTTKQAAWLANKLINLRIFSDEQGKINKSLLDSHGQVLVVSQFTLYADYAGGRRPSFIQAADPDLAASLYEYFIDELKNGGINVQSGIFAADMKVSLINDGPFTMIMERSHNI